nr:hypothetical protein Iba_chr12bCG28130 [Ipomoea batatas]GME06884.1 hypothetical protein Iba_scaffold5504CG0030 [Ipomoea batatas]GME11500.1 hypothetical protein Iba_scaffold11755CG0010 [Ipomoea batatas]
MAAASVGDHGREGEEGWNWCGSACGHAPEGAGVVGTGCDRSSLPGHLVYQSLAHPSAPESPGPGLADGDPGRRRGRPLPQPSIAMPRFGEDKP